MNNDTYVNDIPSIGVRIKKQTHDFVTEAIDISVKGLSLDECEAKLNALLDKITREKL